MAMLMRWCDIQKVTVNFSLNVHMWTASGKETNWETQSESLQKGVLAIVQWGVGGMMLGSIPIRATYVFLMSVYSLIEIYSVIKIK